MALAPQPDWKLVANLGDVNPLDYGGYLVYVDSTGVYPPEALKIEPLDDSSEADARLAIRRIVLDLCTFVDGVLSDNPFHADFAAWFASDLSEVASYIGSSEDSMRDDLCSRDPIKMAFAYQAIADYHGWDNFGAEDEISRAEAIDRYGS